VVCLGRGAVLLRRHHQRKDEILLRHLPARHEGKLEEAEWGGNGHLLDVVWVDRDLVISSHQVDFGEGGTAEKLV
jgi:hypothetical protein